MATQSLSLSWTSSYTVAPSSRSTKDLPGDKILLPPSALEQLLAACTMIVVDSNHPRAAFDPFNPYEVASARQEQSQWRETQQQLPHPLTFRLVNPKNGNVVHAGIREFSAAEGEIGLSPFLLTALGLHERHANGAGEAAETPIDLTDEDTVIKGLDRITVHAKELPKGTYVRLRPLEAGYNPEDWKSLLERHLRDSYTTLTNGEILTIPGDRRAKTNEFRFLIDKFLPEGDGICVVDTDLEVDIEALNEEQARETMKEMMKKPQQTSGSSEGSSAGGTLDVWKAVEGRVLEGDYVDYELLSWDRSRGIDIELSTDEEVNIFVSPFSARQRSRPRDDEHVFGDFTSERPLKRIRLQASNVEMEGAESLYISVHGSQAPSDLEASADTRPRHFSIRAKVVEKETFIDLSNDSDEAHGPDDERCKNCLQWVPSRTMMLHTNFCLRNNILCPHCSTVFKKSSAEWAAHWHCPHDSAHGTQPSSLTTHNQIFHTPAPCPNCAYEGPSLPSLATHRTSVCPGKLILCQFCHLTVPQEGDPFNPSADALLSGLTEHELRDGARTTNCHLCQAIVRLRDLSTHLKHHDISRQSKPTPHICTNKLCGRTLDGINTSGGIGRTSSTTASQPKNELGLCAICFGPLYVSMHDPDGRAMQRRIERRYLQQLIQGCGKEWCANAYCKSGRSHAGMGEVEVLTTKEALPMVKTLMLGGGDAGKTMWLCVDEGSQRRRKLAEMMEGEGVYELAWAMAGLEAGNGELDAARQWLVNWAPKKVEASR